MRDDKFDWNQARAFLASAEEGSLSAAARALGVTQPTISRQVAGLEESLGVALFERTPRALLLTQAGTELLAHFRSMGEAAERVSIVAAGQAESIVGHVAITATELMVTHFLLPILEPLRVRAPGLQVEIIASNQVSDLRQRDADIAIRHNRPEDRSLFCRQMRGSQARIFASKRYIEEVGRPTCGADVAKMMFVGIEDPQWLLGPLASRGLELTSSSFNFHTASGTVLLELVRQGFGVGFLPREIAAKYPELDEVWREFDPIPIETWLVAHRELRSNPRIRLVFDLLSDGLQ